MQHPRTQHPELNDKEVARIEAGFKRTRRAWELLDLIAMEFATDPNATACFDARIVNETLALVKAQRAAATILEPLGRT